MSNNKSKGEIISDLKNKLNEFKSKYKTNKSNNVQNPDNNNEDELFSNINRNTLNNFIIHKQNVYSVPLENTSINKNENKLSDLLINSNFPRKNSLNDLNISVNKRETNNNDRQNIGLNINNNTNLNIFNEINNKNTKDNSFMTKYSNYLNKSNKEFYLNDNSRNNNINNSLSFNNKQTKYNYINYSLDDKKYLDFNINGILGNKKNDQRQKSEPKVSTSYVSNINNPKTQNFINKNNNTSNLYSSIYHKSNKNNNSYINLKIPLNDSLKTERNLNYISNNNNYENYQEEYTKLKTKIDQFTQELKDYGKSNGSSMNNLYKNKNSFDTEKYKINVNDFNSNLENDNKNKSFFNNRPIDNIINTSQYNNNSLYYLNNENRKNAKYKYEGNNNNRLKNYKGSSPNLMLGITNNNTNKSMSYLNNDIKNLKNNSINYKNNYLYTNSEEDLSKNDKNVLTYNYIHQLNQAIKNLNKYDIDKLPLPVVNEIKELHNILTIKFFNK